MRSAAILFALLAILLLLVDGIAWLNGAPLRAHPLQVSTFVVYCALTVVLWRRVAFTAIAGLIVAVAGLIILSGAIYFLWPNVSPGLTTTRGMLVFIGTMIVPWALNLGIAVALLKALVSDRRRRWT